MSDAVEFDKHAWVRFGLGVLAFTGIIWGESQAFASTTDRSIRNEGSVLNLNSSISECKKNYASEFKELRGITSDIKLESAEAKTMQTVILSRLDKMDRDGERNHNEIMSFIRTLEIAE